MARVSASTSSGVFLIWYFMCTALVLMNVWMRGTSATFTASQQTRMSSSMARARPAMRGPFTSLAMALTASKSSGEAIGKPASMMSTRSWRAGGRPRASRPCSSVAPGACSPSRSVVSKILMYLSLLTSHLHLLKACVVARWELDPDVIQGVAVQAGRCLRIPPEGEEQQAAEEGEVAGAYPNVGLPAGLACARRRMVRRVYATRACSAQAIRSSPDGDRHARSDTIGVSLGDSRRGTS